VGKKLSRIPILLSQLGVRTATIVAISRCMQYRKRHRHDLDKPFCQSEARYIQVHQPP
jgi:hypothetical protein